MDLAFILIMSRVLVCTLYKDNGMAKSFVCQDATWNGASLKVACALAYKRFPLRSLRSNHNKYARTCLLVAWKAFENWFFSFVVCRKAEREITRLT